MLRSFKERGFREAFRRLQRLNRPGQTNRQTNRQTDRQTRTDEKIIEDYRIIQKLKKNIIEDYRRIQKLNNNQSNSEERRR